MKLLAALLMVVTTVTAFGQSSETYTDGEKDCIREYDQNEVLREEGCFLDGKAEGKWVQYNAEGEVEIVGYYNNGQKEGTWYFYKNDQNKMYELFYENNYLTNSNLWTIEARNITR